MEAINGVMPTYEINKGGGEGYGWGGGMWFAWILILFVLMGGWGNGFGGRNAQAGFDVASQFDYQDIKNGIRGIQQGLCDGFYAQNTTMLQGFNGMQRDLCQGFAAVNAGINENRFAQQQCCCENLRALDNVRYENAQNTCAITTNATGNTQKILDKLCQMEANAKDQRIADLTASLQAANGQISQLSQTANIINAVIPRPVPAYNVQSPYVGTGYAYGCGCGGCGCA